MVDKVKVLMAGLAVVPLLFAHSLLGPAEAVRDASPRGNLTSNVQYKPNWSTARTMGLAPAQHPITHYGYR